MSQSFLDEFRSAARGCYALLTGKKQAATYFDLSPAGLAGSLAMVLLVIALTSFSKLPIDGETVAPTSAGLDILLSVGAYGVQCGAAYAYFSVIKRLDGFVPYLVASNWVAVFSAIALQLALLIVAYGPALLGFLVLVAIVAASLMLFVNVGRLIATLKPVQILVLLAVDGTALFFGLALLATFLPAPPV